MSLVDVNHRKAVNIVLLNFDWISSNFTKKEKKKMQTTKFEVYSYSLKEKISFNIIKRLLLGVAAVQICLS